MDWRKQQTGMAHLRRAEDAAPLLHSTRTKQHTYHSSIPFRLWMWCACRPCRVWLPQESPLPLPLVWLVWANYAPNTFWWIRQSTESPWKIFALALCASGLGTVSVEFRSLFHRILLDLFVFLQVYNLWSGVFLSFSTVCWIKPQSMMNRTGWERCIHDGT